jgi:hypothetical protein
LLSKTINPKRQIGLLRERKANASKTRTNI